MKCGGSARHTEPSSGDIDMMTPNEPSQVLAHSPSAIIWNVLYGNKDICELANLLDAALKALDSLAERIQIFGDDYSQPIMHASTMAVSAVDKIYKHMGLVRNGKFDRSTTAVHIALDPKDDYRGHSEKGQTAEFLIALLHVLLEVYECGFDGWLRVPGKVPFPSVRVMKKLRWVATGFQELRGSIIGVEKTEEEISTQHELYKFPECAKDCILTIKEGGRRMTTPELMAAMKVAGRIHGTSTIKMTLAYLTKKSSLTNRTQPKPRGYGLPESK
jgi:hypothetical protein